MARQIRDSRIKVRFDNDMTSIGIRRRGKGGWGAAYCTDEARCRKLKK